MKRYIILSIVLLCSVFNTVSAKVNPPFSGTDTLKKDKNYILISKTEHIGMVTFKKSKKENNILTIRYGYPTPVPASNVVGGAAIIQGNAQYGESAPLPTFDKIQIIKGNYANVTAEKDTKYRTLFTFTMLEFPLHLKLESGKEMIDFILFGTGELEHEHRIKK